MKKSLKIFASLVLLLSFYSCNNEQKEFTKAKQANSIVALKEFATNYPNGNYTDNAKVLVDSMVWQVVRSKDSIRNYEIFIEEHPKSMYIDSAKGIVDKSIWQEVKSLNSTSDYETFIEDYPENRYIDSAKLIIGKQDPISEEEETD